jgi:hypothetical protein
MLDSNSTADAHATADLHSTADLHATADLKGERMRGDLYARKPSGRGNLTFALLFLGYSSEKNGKIHVPTHSRIGRVEPLGTLEYSNCHYTPFFPAWFVCNPLALDLEIHQHVTRLGPFNSDPPLAPPFRLDQPHTARLRCIGE